MSSFRVYKHGTFLNELGEYHQIWIDCEAKAMVFYDRSRAQAVADTYDAHVVAQTVLN